MHWERTQAKPDFVFAHTDHHVTDVGTSYREVGLPAADDMVIRARSNDVAHPLKPNSLLFFGLSQTPKRADKPKKTGLPAATNTLHRAVV